MGIKATGTIRDNRTGKCPLTGLKEMSKKDRGEFDGRGDGNVVCVRWHDNSVVSLMSNWQEIKPLQVAKRYSAKEKKKVQIKQPYLIHEYNKG